MDIATFLLGQAFQSKRLKVDQTETHIKLVANFCGMEILLAAISLEDIKKAEQAAKRARFSVVS